MVVGEDTDHGIKLSMVVGEDTDHGIKLDFSTRSGRLPFAARTFGLNDKVIYP